jgi:predicted dehydrogenase
MIDAAVIGLGRWGKALVTAVQGKSQRLRFVHGVSKEPDSVRAFTDQHGLRLSTNLEDALADPAVQAVFLVTPHSLHVPQIEAVARAGLPVWCEKPLALTRKEAARAVAACHAAGVVLASGNNKRCYASMRELRRAIDDGVLGDVLHVEAHFSNEHSTRVIGGGRRDDPREAPGGGLSGAGLHILDALIGIGGPIRSVDAKLFERKPAPDPRDSLAVLVQFASGATGTMATVRAAPAFWRVHVFGTKGMAEARDEETLIVGRIGETPQTHVYDHVDSLKVLAESFADAIKGRAPFLVSTDQMLDLIGAFEAVLASLETRAPALING